MSSIPALKVRAVGEQRREHVALVVGVEQTLGGYVVYATGGLVEGPALIVATACRFRAHFAARVALESTRRLAIDQLEQRLTACIRSVAVQVPLLVGATVCAERVHRAGSVRVQHVAGRLVRQHGERVELLGVNDDDKAQQTNHEY